MKKKNIKTSSGLASADSKDFELLMLKFIQGVSVSSLAQEMVKLCDTITTVSLRALMRAAISVAIGNRNTLDSSLPEEKVIALTIPGFSINGKANVTKLAIFGHLLLTDPELCGSKIHQAWHSKINAESVFKMGNFNAFSEKRRDIMRQFVSKAAHNDEAQKLVVDTVKGKLKVNYCTTHVNSQCL